MIEYCPYASQPVVKLITDGSEHTVSHVATLPTCIRAVDPSTTNGSGPALLRRVCLNLADRARELQGNGRQKKFDYLLRNNGRVDLIILCNMMQDRRCSSRHVNPPARRRPAAALNDGEAWIPNPGFQAGKLEYSGELSRILVCVPRFETDQCCVLPPKGDLLGPSLCGPSWRSARRPRY